VFVAELKPISNIDKFEILAPKASNAKNKAIGEHDFCTQRSRAQ